MIISHKQVKKVISGYLIKILKQVPLPIEKTMWKSHAHTVNNELEITDKSTSTDIYYVRNIRYRAFYNFITMI